MERREQAADVFAGHEGDGITEFLCSCRQLWVQLCQGAEPQPPTPALAVAQASVPKTRFRQNPSASECKRLIYSSPADLPGAEGGRGCSHCRWREGQPHPAVVNTRAGCIPSTFLQYWLGSRSSSMRTSLVLFMV